MTCHVCADPTCIEDHFKMSDNKCNSCKHNTDYLEKPYGSRCTTCVGFREYEPLHSRAANQNQPSSRYVGGIERRLRQPSESGPDKSPIAEVSKTGSPVKQENLKKYLPLAKEVANLSKDWSSKVGALVIGPDGESGPWGYNGAVRGCSADEDERKEAREIKNLYAEHAERNAIYAAARTGFKVHGCSMVVTHFPCMDCARAIVQAGIVKVVCPAPSGEFAERWKDSITLARGLFVECGVELEEVSL